MNPAPTRLNKSGYLFLIARIILGAVFIYLGAVKAADTVEFLKLIRQFEMIEKPLLLNLLAAVLPWLEIMCGLLVIAGFRLRAATLLILIMLAAFTAVVAVRALDMAHAGSVPFCSISFDCGCGSGEVLICRKLLENSALLALAIAVLVTKDPKFCLFSK